jgi:ATP-dependent Clp protease ATP-binding subunit ClpC
MFEKFTEGSVRVIMAAQNEAKRMGHSYVGTEHMMLGLIAQKHAIPGMVLWLQGVRLKPFRREVEKHIGRGRGFLSLEVPFTPRAKRILELAINESKQLAVNYVGSEHLFLAIMTEGDGIAMKILDKFKINYVQTRRLVFQFIEDIETYGPIPPKPPRPVTPGMKRIIAERERIYGPAKIDPDEDDEYYDQTQYYGRDGVDPNKRYKSRKTRVPEDDPWSRSGRSLKDRTEGELQRQMEERQQAIRRLREHLAAAAEEGRPNYKKRSRNKRNNKIKNLEDYGVNITREARDKLLDPVIGRDEEILTLIKVLGRRRKNNPVIVGEPGVGKTACAEGLALLMAEEQNCPDFLRNFEIYNLDLGAVLAGTKYRGEFEERFKNILDEVQEQNNVILVIDEVHTIVGAGAAEGAVDAANLLKPALARGAFKMIGATTLDEYRKHIEKDPALERRFHPIPVDEPSVETTIDILKGLRPYYQTHHSLLYEDNALEAAAALSHRFITDRQLPDKAIDVIDECGSQVRLRNRELPPGLQKLLIELHETLKDIEEAIQEQDFNLAKLLIEHELEVRAHMRVLTVALENNKKFLNKISTFDRVRDQDITDVISDWTGIPVSKINESETERLKKMENILHDRLIGQHHAVTAVSKAVRRARTGIQDPKRPIASFIFAGPTGVGKTELTKALAEYIFDTEKNMIRFDMSEFMEKHTAAKLVGSPPGYVGHDEGGQLTDAVRRKPYSIILFDEVEKAHPDIFNLFLQILDDGQLTDSKGRLSDFKNCIIVMTTNLGAHAIEEYSPILPQKQFGFNNDLEFGNEKAGKESQKIELMVNLDGTFTVKPPVEPKITSEDKAQFSKIQGLVQDELKKFFRPEFLNRVDDIIVFQHLSRYDIWEIAGVMLNNLAKRLEFNGATIEIDNAVRFFLAEQGYDPVYGARPLRRAIIKFLEDELAVACLDNPLEQGTHIIVKQELNPNPVKYAEYFDEVYSDKILITFDKNKMRTVEKKENDFVSTVDIDSLDLELPFQ